MQNEQFDSGDVDALAELVQTKGWGIVSRWMEGEIARLHDRLAHDLAERDTANVRGQIEAAKRFKGLPVRLIQEISKVLKLEAVA